MPELSLENDTTIYQEMMSHPALFSHPSPQKIAIIGDQQDHILNEVLKHPSTTEAWQLSNSGKTTLSDVRIQTHREDTFLPADYFDVIIIAQAPQISQFDHYFNALTAEGILLQLSDSPFHVHTLKTLQTSFQKAGFRDVNTITFPQPNFITGWRTSILAKKSNIFRKIREKAIFNKNFPTRYYNLDVHKAALVQPEFMREALLTQENL